METLDSRRICEAENCPNIGEWSKIINNKVYRRKLCCKHRKNTDFIRRYGYAREKFKKDCAKCDLCGWIGPCDVHRIQKGGIYTLENMKSLCPNCHRLIHLGKISSP